MVISRFIPYIMIAVLLYLIVDFIRSGIILRWREKYELRKRRKKFRKQVEKR